MLRRALAGFVADRGTHLAAMIAYFALLSFVPLVFIAISLLGLAGRADESSLLVRELRRILPRSSVDTLVQVVAAVQDSATVLGAVGVVVLLWSSLSLFAALESALNIVYRRPNRPFLHGKALALGSLVGSLVLMFAGLLVASVGASTLRHEGPGPLGSPVLSYALSILVSAVAAFAFVGTAYRVLINADLAARDLWPGALVATAGLVASFQALPVYVGLSKHSPIAQALGAPVILLVWFYAMALVIVLGAEVNIARERTGEPDPDGTPPG